MIADYHAQAIAAARGAKLVGIATRNADNARTFAAKHNVAFATTDVAALLARPDIDVVCITTPSGAHLEPALAAVRAGKHLVVEKPIEITTERADELLRAADAAKIKISPIFQARFGEGARTLKAALTAGRFGRLVLASAYVKWHRSREYYSGWKGTLALDGGGATMNQGIHGIDLLQWFAGMPSEVFAWKTRRVYEHIEAEDTLGATLKYANGALGSIETTTAAWPGWSRRIEICGENGSARLEDDHLAEWKFRTPLPQDDAIRAAGLGQSILSAYRHETLHEIVAHFGLTPHFDHIVGLDNIHAHSKLALGRDLVARLDVSPTEILLVGDTLHDAEVARELGVACALIAAGHHPAARLSTAGVPVFANLTDFAAAHHLHGISASGAGKI
eukprot:gene42294-57261_t